MMVVVPGLMGYCSFSPRLDKYGNSYRGIEFSKAMSETFNLHYFSCDKSSALKSRYSGYD